jgi:hypothetical protein
VRTRRILVLLLLLPPVLGDAETFVVDSELDIEDADLLDGVCASPGGTCTLRAAVQQANFRAGFDRIELPAGIFALTREGAARTRR